MFSIVSPRAPGNHQNPSSLPEKNADRRLSKKNKKKLVTSGKNITTILHIWGKVGLSRKTEKKKESHELYLPFPPFYLFFFLPSSVERKKILYVIKKEK